LGESLCAVDRSNRLWIGISGDSQSLTRPFAREQPQLARRYHRLSQDDPQTVSCWDVEVKNLQRRETGFWNRGVQLLV
jgi:hypothetical protein